MLCFMCPSVTGGGDYSEFLVCIIKLNYKKPIWLMCVHPM